MLDQTDGCHIMCFLSVNFLYDVIIAYSNIVTSRICYQYTFWDVQGYE